MAKLKKPTNLSPIESLMVKEMEKGYSSARDPFNAHASDIMLRKTSFGSAWFIGTCMVCEDTFREDDWVYQCPDTKEYFHEDERFGLKCWTNHRKNCTFCKKDPSFYPQKPFGLQDSDEAPQDILFVKEDFFEGLNTTWQVRHETEDAVEVKVAKVGERALGKQCPVCPHKIRLGDSFVESPCKCGAYFHSDTIRHLNCWNVRMVNSKRPLSCPIHNGECHNGIKPAEAVSAPTTTVFVPVEPPAES